MNENKTNINWYIPTYINFPSTSYNISVFK